MPSLPTLNTGNNPSRLDSTPMRSQEPASTATSEGTTTAPTNFLGIPTGPRSAVTRKSRTGANGGFHFGNRSLVLNSSGPGTQGRARSQQTSTTPAARQISPSSCAARKRFPELFEQILATARTAFPSTILRVIDSKPSTKPLMETEVFDIEIKCVVPTNPFKPGTTSWWQAILVYNPPDFPGVALCSTPCVDVEEALKSLMEKTGKTAEEMRAGGMEGGCGNEVAKHGNEAVGKLA